MRHPAALPCLAISLLLAACGTRHSAAGLVLRNGDSRTMDPRTPQATAMAITAGRIVFVGTDARAGKWIGDQTAVVDAGGLTVLPGLIDSHIHVAESALSLGGCTLHNEQQTIQQAAPHIRECVAADQVST